MSDNDNNTTAGGDESVGGMAAADVKFLVTCLQNTTSGSISVDYNKVAEIVNFKHPKSVSNKINALKKKFNLPIGSTSVRGAGTPDKAGKTSTLRKASSATGPKDSAIPKTLSKTRVTKRAAPPSTKKKATPKDKKGSQEEEAKAENDDEEMKEQPVDEATEIKNAYEEVFDKGEEGEDEGNEDEGEDDDAYAA